MTLTFAHGVRNFHTLFLVMLAICVHEFNRIWAFFLDQNHLETPKVMTLTVDLGVRNFQTIFSVMLPLCVHKLSRFWVFFLDQNHLETPKVMTLTFDLENEKQPYLIKLWCIMYLNTKFDGCSMKTAYIAKKKGKTSMTSGDIDLWDMVTKKNCTIPGVCLLIGPKIMLIRPVVSEEYAKLQTDKQTGLRYYNIDSIMASTHYLLLQWTTFQNQHFKSTIPQNYS